MTAPRLFHFSDDGGIERFHPRPVRVPSARPPGMEWLNGPLVWAVTEERQATYLFPRDCPRILLWRTPRTTDEDRARWFGDSTATMIANVEWAWLDQIRSATLHRYELPADAFQPLDGDGWMWVSTRDVGPVGVERVDDVLSAHATERTELRFLPSLLPLRVVWSTSLHASGIRLRNAQDWPAS